MPKCDLSYHGEYAPVAERVRLFYERYPQGSILTRLVSRTPEDITFKAWVYRAPDERRPAATGWAAERPGDGDVNTVACLENAETSAVGRALANLGFTASRHRPSAEEMAKAERARGATRAGGRESRGGERVGDVIALLAEAERAGVRPLRSARMRARLASPASPDVARIERLLRRWLTRHGGGGGDVPGGRQYP